VFLPVQYILLSVENLWKNIPAGTCRCIHEQISGIMTPEKNTNSDAASLADGKQALRSRYRQACEALTPATRREKAGQLFYHIMQTPLYRQAQVIMVFVGTGWEVPTHEFIKEALNDGKRVVLPYCSNDGSSLGVGEIIDFFRDVVPGKYNIPEPVVRVRDTLPVKDIDLVLCPGVAFDRYGGRLGRGKGYYDRFFARLPHEIPIWGIAFSCQIHGEYLPVRQHDMPINGVVTEDGFL